MCLCMRVHVSVTHFSQGQCVFVYLTKTVRVKTIVSARLKQAVHMFGLTSCVYVCAWVSEWLNLRERERGRGIWERKTERDRGSRSAEWSESGPEAQFHTALKHINWG